MTKVNLMGKQVVEVVLFQTTLLAKEKNGTDVTCHRYHIETSKNKTTVMIHGINGN